MRSRTVDHWEVDASVVVTAIIGAAITFLGWVIRVAARSTLEGLRTSIDAHAKSLTDLRSEIAQFREDLGGLRVEVAEVRGRIKALES